MFFLQNSFYLLKSTLFSIYSTLKHLVHISSPELDVKLLEGRNHVLLYSISLKDPWLSLAYDQHPIRVGWMNSDESRFALICLRSKITQRCSKRGNFDMLMTSYRKNEHKLALLTRARQQNELFFNREKHSRAVTVQWEDIAWLLSCLLLDASVSTPSLTPLSVSSDKMAWE